MTAFEELCMNLELKPGTEFERVVSNMVCEMIFEDYSYTDEEIASVVTERFYKAFPYMKK